MMGKIGTSGIVLRSGWTEETDCIALIVSEETGQISVAAFGELERDVTTARVEERLALHSKYLTSEIDRTPASVEQARGESV